uniref:Uncharacterized protein n=1 Tax=Steinernema glaseri TaxID=37863 RepID=A0A1I8A263_9BILA
MMSENQRSFRTWCQCPVLLIEKVLRAERRRVADESTEVEQFVALAHLSALISSGIFSVDACHRRSLCFATRCGHNRT